MTQDAPDQTSWPLPKFSFLVSWDDTEASFQEVSGLDTETDVIEYRAGNSKVFSTIKMPKMQQASNVTLKRGLVTNDHAFWEWFNAIKMNTITRKTVTIALLDETGKATMTWTLRNAFPTKITSNDLKAEDNGVAIETLEIAHEGLEIASR